MLLSHNCVFFSACNRNDDPPPQQSNCTACLLAVAVIWIQLNLNLRRTVAWIRRYLKLWWQSRQALIVNGPTTSHKLPLYSWSQFPNVSHAGVPEVMNFSLASETPQ